jgi:hypothetical protein
MTMSRAKKPATQLYTLGACSHPERRYCVLRSAGGRKVSSTYSCAFSFEYSRTGSALSRGRKTNERL